MTNPPFHTVDPGSSPPPLPHHHHDRHHAAPATIVVDHVSKVFGTGDDQVTAIADVSFEVPSGQFLSIVGPSGCGKSTLLRLIAGLDIVSSGEISITGISPREARRRREFGVVF